METPELLLPRSVGQARFRSQEARLRVHLVLGEARSPRGRGREVEAMAEAIFAKCSQLHLPTGQTFHAKSQGPLGTKGDTANRCPSEVKIALSFLMGEKHRHLTHQFQSCWVGNAKKKFGAAFQPLKHYPLCSFETREAETAC